MARVTSHVIRVRNVSKPTENHLLCLKSTLAIIYRPNDFILNFSPPHENSLIRDSTIFRVIANNFPSSSCSLSAFWNQLKC